MNDLTEYLRFEGEFIQEELEMLEVFQSPETRNAVRNKRHEAIQVWQSQGKVLPEGVTY